MPYFVYILLCADNSLYTGITTNLERRILAHKNGKGGAYTRSHKAVKIVYKEKYASRSQALKREMRIKKLSKREKQTLINGN